MVTLIDKIIKTGSFYARCDRMIRISNGRLTTTSSTSGQPLQWWSNRNQFKYLSIVEQTCRACGTKRNDNDVNRPSNGLKNNNNSDGAVSVNCSRSSDRMWAQSNFVIRKAWKHLVRKWSIEDFSHFCDNLLLMSPNGDAQARWSPDKGNVMVHWDEIIRREGDDRDRDSRLDDWRRIELRRAFLEFSKRNPFLQIPTELSANHKSREETAAWLSIEALAIFQVNWTTATATTAMP